MRKSADHSESWSAGRTFTHKFSASVFGGSEAYVLRINTSIGPVSKILVRE